MPARRSTTRSQSALTSFVYSILLLAVFALPAWEQETPPAPVSGSQPASAVPAQQPNTPGTPASLPQPAGTSQKEVPGAGVAVQEKQQTESQAPEQQPLEAPSGPITKQQAQDLFRSVDQILQFASNDTALPIKHSVKRKLITRQAVQSYVEKRMKDDKDTQKLERSQAVLVKFGLLPPNYDLHAEFVNVLREQVAAYYEARKKTVYMLDWVPPDQQKPVLAHELTHALQDQYIGLEKWELAGGRPDGSPLPDNQEEVVEEAEAARDAVTEGQAMIVFLDYSLAPLGVDVLKAPDVVDAMRSEMGKAQDSPEFSNAPLYLQESLLFPYAFGSDFVRHVLTQKGKQAAYAGVLDDPPIDTRQIMEPETYLANEKVPPIAIPDLNQLIAPNYERYDFGGMGEFDVYLLMKQYAPDDDPKRIYAHWRGGYYLAAHAKNAPKNQVALIYLSRWDSPESAEAFANVYKAYTPRRYPQWQKEATTAAAAGGDIPFHTELALGEGTDRVYIEENGNQLLILESFDEAEAQRLKQALLEDTARDTNIPAARSQKPN
jgi:hypothetical protein